MDSDTVWRALASPHRRKLLDLLRSGPKSTGELARELGSLTRFAVMQHLEVLTSAGLVLNRKEGRTRMNYANPVPVREIYERWVSPPASRAAETDLHLKRYAERATQVDQSMDKSNFQHIKIETETHIKAPRERVFAAMTDEFDAWWPHRYKPDSRYTVEAKPGGFMIEHFTSGGGAVTGTVVYIDAPNALIATGPSSLLRGVQSYNSQTFVDDGSGGTVLKRSMEIWGAIPDGMEQMFRDGTRQMLESALRGYLEEGKTYGAEVNL